MKIQTLKKTTPSPEYTLARVCVDLSENTFHIVGFDAKGSKVLRKKLSRNHFMEWLARPDLPPVVVAMEACGGAHWWGQYCQSLGHTPKLLPPAVQQNLWGPPGGSGRSPSV